MLRLLYAKTSDLRPGCYVYWGEGSHTPGLCGCIESWKWSLIISLKLVRTFQNRKVGWITSVYHCQWIPFHSSFGICLMYSWTYCYFLNRALNIRSVNWLLTPMTCWDIKKNLWSVFSCLPMVHWGATCWAQCLEWADGSCMGIFFTEAIDEETLAGLGYGFYSSSSVLIMCRMYL